MGCDIDVIVIDAATASLRREVHASVDAALLSVGLRVPDSNRGPLRPGLNVALAVWALVGDPSTYYAIDGQLFNGPAVLFAADADGREVSVPTPINIKVTWFGDVDDVERAIAAGEVSRPRRSVSGVVTWSWTGEQMTSEEANARAHTANAAAIERLGNEGKL